MPGVSDLAFRMLLVFRFKGSKMLAFCLTHDNQVQQRIVLPNMSVVLTFRNIGLRWLKNISFSYHRHKNTGFYVSILIPDFLLLLFVGIGKRIEREEEEEEEALPLDMMDEDDLQLMKDLGQRASFLTRDISSR